MGSKARVIDRILAEIPDTVTNTIDAFSGSSRVCSSMRQAGYVVHANDYTTFASTLARAYICSTEKDLLEASGHIEELNNLTPVEGYFVENYHRQAWFFQEENAKKLQAAINYASKMPSGVVRDIVHTSIMIAMNNVDSNCGQYAGYLKNWSARSGKDIEFVTPDIPFSGPVGTVSQKDIMDIEFDGGEDTLLYLDPPYSTHNYKRYYHIYDTVCLNDDPEVVDKVLRRKDSKTDRSPFNYRKEASDAIRQVIDKASGMYVLLSYSSEGIANLEKVLEGLPHIIDGRIHPRYIGSRIGQHNAKGIRVGSPTHHECIEYTILIPPRK